MSDPRGRLLMAALGFAGLPLPSYDPALHALRSWLDSWSGIGRVAVGMARQGYDVLRQNLIHLDRGGLMLGQGKERQESSGSLDARPCSADKLQALEPGRRQGCRRSLAVGLSR